MPNIAELSEAKRALLEKYRRGDISQSTTTTSVIPRRTSDGPVPLSFGQQQLWFLAQLIPDMPVYNECVTLHLPGSLNVDALKQCFHEIIRRHEAWRTSFPQVDGQPVQRIHPSLTVPLPFVDLRYLPILEREAEALRLATEDGQKPFDLAQGPLLRAMLIQLDDMEHRLYLTLHHIIFDGISIYQIFLSELCTLYKVFSAGKISPLPELPIQYADFALWQREQLQQNVFDKQLNYWKKQLEEAPALLELPTDRPRPLNPTYCGSTYPVTLSKSLIDALRALSNQEGCTLYMTMIAAFKTLLFRYTQQDDILVGTATGGRNRSEVQDLLGVFINMLVMRTRLTGDMSFRELLGHVREETLEAHAHQDVPFGYLVKELQPERGMGQNPFFQVLFMLEPPISVLPLGWTLTHMDVKTDTSKFDLSLILEDRPKGLVGFFEYSTDLFDSATIERMEGHLQTILEGIVAAPEKRLAELPVLTEAEQQLMLVEWNNTSQDFPAEQCFHQLFEAQVERTPDAVAVVFEDKHLTYHELNSRANQLAHYLQKLGVGPATLVGICTERSLDMVVALLSVLKSGGAYVPLDPAYPKDRLAFTLEDAQVQVLLTKQSLVKHLPQYISKLISLDTDWEVIAQERDENLISETTQENLAYVIYTSGSTGRPKGVAIAHRSVVAFVVWAQSVFSSEDLAGVLASTSICFDLSVFELFVTLSSGGTVILAENVLHLPNLTAKEQVTLINTVPSAMTELLRLNSLPSSIRIVNLAGEPLHSTLVQQIYRQNTVKRVFNLYGPSEDTTYSTYALAENEESEPSIGRPISNTQVYILDAHLQPVPIGVAGELYIGGDGLAVGYLHHPELTAKRFIPNPYKVGTRLYKTDDLVRYKPDGNIEFLGRIDHQVKLRGFRIELGEIEEVLLQHPEVQEAVVKMWEDTTRGKYLAAYIVAVRDQTPLIKNLQSFLKEKLPEYMIPSTFILLDVLPLTPNGKLDRRALQVPKPDNHAAEETFVAPTQMVHYQLLQIWEELLNVHPIGIRDNFFYLGGHSLLAVHLIERIEQIFHQKLQLATLFAGPTIEQLTAALEGQVESSSQLPVKAIQIQAGKAKRPFFFLHGNWRGDGFYCYPLARALGKEQPFYALPPYPLDGLQRPPTLEEMAAAYIEVLRTEQPEGPYMLGGWCNGALVAYEMARQLHTQAQKVDMLILVHPADLVSPAHIRWARNAISYLGYLLHLSPEKQLDWFLRLCHMSNYLHNTAYQQTIEFNRLKVASQAKWTCRGKRKGWLLSHLGMLFPAIDLLRTYEPIFTWIASRYAPSGLYTGKMSFLWPRDEAYDKAAQSWQQVIESVEARVDVLPGTHEKLLIEHLAELAERLRLYIESVSHLDF